jgi:DNA-binding SARP family transcriptional activator
VAIQFRILGPIEAVDEGGEIVDLGRPQQKAVLAMLLVHANQVVARDRLIETLWQREPPQNALNALQVYVSRLRKALGPEAIATRPPGYLVQISDGELDLRSFERLVADGRTRLGSGEHVEAAAVLRDALDLWRGPVLADFAYEPFAQPVIARLEEIRLEAIELRIEADLAAGHHVELIGELEQLVAEHPLRERLREHLMLALYRSGRQAGALDEYRQARRALVDGLGIEPSAALHRLEQAILRHDPALDLTTQPTAPFDDAPDRAVLVLAETMSGLDVLVAFAEPIAAQPRRELILTRLVREPGELTETMVALDERRQELGRRGVTARVTTYTSDRFAEDVVRLATTQDVDLLLVEAPRTLIETGAITGDLGAILAEAPCDVAVVVGRNGPLRLDAERGVIVPFSGSENDWSAIEMGAWVARSQGASLWLTGSTAAPKHAKRNASRLLGNAALVVQKVAGIVARPRLVEPGAEGVLDAVRDAGLLLLALPDDWQKRGLGHERRRLAAEAEPPVLLVRRGTRPGGLAPEQSVSRYSWTLAEPQS